MAKSIILPLFVSFFVIVSPVLSRVISEEISYSPTLPPMGHVTYAPEYNQPEPAMPPEPYPGYYSYLENCADQLGEKCGPEIFYGIFYKRFISDECCGILNEVGKKCTDGLLKNILLIPQNKKNEALAWERNDRVWKRCSASASPVPSPSSD